jgi:toxin CcdB
MAQFDVHANRSQRQGTVPFVVDVQSDLLHGLHSRVVIPLYRRDAVPRPLAVLNPVLVITETEVVLVTQEIAAVPPAALGPRVGSLADQRDAIVRAIDMLLSGV